MFLCNYMMIDVPDNCLFKSRVGCDTFIVHSIPGYLICDLYFQFVT